MKDAKGYFKGQGYAAKGALKLKTVKDLPPDQVMIGFIKQVVKLNDQGVKRKKSATKKPEAEEPA